MGHFNFKSLTFYGVAIGAVLLLFEVVTAYGEANLKAPAAIDGRYRLSYTQNLPECRKSDALVLTIQQSGIYLNGSLSPAQTNAQLPTSAEEKLSMTGQLSNQQLSLSGTVPRSTFCMNAIPQAEAIARSSSVRIQSQVEGKNLEGKITLSGIPEAIGFTAQRENPVQKSESSSH